MDDVQIERRLTTLEQSSQYMADQIVDMQSTQSEIRDLALSVNSLAGSVKRLVEDMCAANRRLDKIESAPGKRLDQIIGYILAAGIGGLISYLIAMVLKG